MSGAAERPLPVANAETRELLAGTRRGELLLQRCGDCGGYRFIPRKFCDQCGSLAWNWRPASGRGELISFATVHQVFHAGFVDRVPYRIGVVELAEGPRLITALLADPQQELRAGLPVRVDFEQRTEEITMPIFRPG